MKIGLKNGVIVTPASITAGIQGNRRDRVNGLTGALLSTEPGGDEESCAAVLNIGGVPDARWVDGILTGAEGGGFDGTVGLFLQKGDATGSAEDDFAAVGMHFPGGPGLGEAMHTDEAAFRSVFAVAFSINGVPGHVACEFRLDFCDRI
jgi:hypothetical protein